MKAARRPMFWYKLVMWLVSIVLSALLIQLGSLVMSDVPTAGKRIDQRDFIDVSRMETVEAQIKTNRTMLEAKADDIADAQFLLESRSLDYETQRQNFQSWIQTRNATQADSQNDEVTERVQLIEAIKLAERDAEQNVATLNQERLVLEANSRDLTAEKQELRDDARDPYDRAIKLEVLKVFLLRLALTLPLILVSIWLVMKKRGSIYWPVYRSFVLFSLFAFFVELVPYLPSYGGYIRVVVGIALALGFAHFAIKGMRRYLDAKQAEEQRPETEKRKAIEYETAVKKISDGQCPSCDRQFPTEKSAKGETAKSTVDFCVHCGFCLYNNCQNCGTRDNSFYHFCGTCGETSKTDEPVT
mgnify:FL=1